MQFFAYLFTWIFMHFSEYLCTWIFMQKIAYLFRLTFLARLRQCKVNNLLPKRCKLSCTQLGTICLVYFGAGAPVQSQQSIHLSGEIKLVLINPNCPSLCRKSVPRRQCKSEVVKCQVIFATKGVN